MADRIYTFLEKYHRLDENQFALRQKRSTTLAVYNYIQGVLECLKNKSNATGLLSDLSKAYDRVSRPILLTKLHEICICSLLKSYPKDRQQYVQIEHIIKSEQLQQLQSNWRTTLSPGKRIGMYAVLDIDLPKITN